MLIFPQPPKPSDEPGRVWEPVYEHDYSGEAVGWTFCADEPPCEIRSVPEVIA
jgi:hypothetical protein